MPLDAAELLPVDSPDLPLQQDVQSLVSGRSFPKRPASEHTNTGQSMRGDVIAPASALLAAAGPGHLAVPP